MRLSVFVFAASCSASSAQDFTPLAWSADTLFAQLELLRDVADSLSPGDALQRPLSVRTIGADHYVADVGANAVVVLDSNARVVRRIGVRGSGPGELYGVSHIAVRDTEVFVGEALNGRVSEFTRSGQFVRTFSSPFAAGAMSATRTDVWSVTRSPTHYAARLTDHAEPHPAFERMRPPRARSTRWSALPGHDLVASDSVTTWILDQGLGALCRYTTAAARPRCNMLPRDLSQRLTRYRDDRVARLEAAMPVQVYAAPVVKDMVRTGQWLALLLPLPELPIVLVNPSDGTLTPVMYAAHALPAWARSARSFAWDGRGFFVVGDDGIGRILLARQPSIHQE